MSGTGAIAGAVTFGIGQAFGAVGGGFNTIGDKLANELGRAFTHGVAQGMIAGYTGGNMLQSFASGAFGSLGGSAFQGVGGKFAGSFAGTVGFSALSGGIGAELSGGEFWRGATTGAMIGALNHMAIHVQQKIYDRQLKKIYDAYPKGNENDPNYVSRDELYKKIGGPLQDWYNEDPSNPNMQNTCALRLSKALNDAGYTIPSSNATYQGNGGKNYFLTVENITTYLSTVFGTPSLLNGTMINGIIWQSNCGWNNATGHVDVIYRRIAGSHFYDQCGTVKYWH